jgi:CIC family chloride channel protein
VSLREGAAALAMRVRGLLGVAGRRRPSMGETQRFLLLSVLIGIFSGLLVVCFHIAIELLAWSTVHARSAGSWSVVLWPPLGAGVAYALVTIYFRSARGSGVNNTKAALYVSDGYVPSRSVPGKFLACTISIGSGNPMGPEDPALQMGAGVASLLGRLFGLARRSMRMIAPTGAAAGIAAAFNTPITGVLFVMEEVVAAWQADVLGSIVLSAVAAVVVVRSFLGDATLFQVPRFALTHPSELLIYALTGVAGGVLAAWFTRYVTRVRGRVGSRPPYVRHTLPVVAGLLVGVTGLWAPEVLGSGYAAIESALHDQFPWRVLALLALLKFATTSISFCAGTPGGMFAPTLFIGAMLGGAIGGLAHLYWPLPTSPAGAYVLVGIGTFFAGVFRAPMTSIFMVFEVSGTYAIILPVMIANTLSYLISRRLQRDSLFHTVGAQDGLQLPSLEDQREAPVQIVEDAMNRERDGLVSDGLTAEGALERLRSQALPGGLLPSPRGGWFEVRRDHLEAACEEGLGEKPVPLIPGVRPAVRVYPDISLDGALKRLGTASILAVVSRANPWLLLGTLTLEDVLRAYGVAQEPGSQPEAEPPAEERG